MNEDIFINLKEIYFNFREELQKHIYNPTFFSDDENYYLIDDFWERDFIVCINIYKKNGKLFIPNFPNFINDITSFIKNIRANKNCKLICKNVLYEFYKDNYENELKKINSIKYYAGYGKLIIQFNNTREKDSLLIVNPKEDNLTEDNIFVISTNRQDIFSLYKYIIQNNNLQVGKLEIHNNNSFLYSLQNYISFFKQDNSEFYKIELLKTFIKIFYFKKSLINFQNENKNCIIKHQEYYLINPKWMENFKKKYKYEKIFNLLSLIDENENNKINYDNLNSFMNSIFEICLNNNGLNFDSTYLSQDFSDTKHIYSLIRNNYNISFFENCYFLPFEIMSFFIKFGLKELDKYKKEILAKNDEIFLFHQKGIEIGKINNEAIFIQKYILLFEDKNIFKEEKTFLLSKPIKDYINHRYCNEQIDNNIQILKHNEKGKIGKLIILKNDINNNIAKNNVKSIQKESQLKFIRIDNELHMNSNSNNKNLLKHISKSTKNKKKKNVRDEKYLSPSRFNVSKELNDNDNVNPKYKKLKNLQNIENNNNTNSDIKKNKLFKTDTNVNDINNNNNLQQRQNLQKENKELKEKINKNIQEINELKNKINKCSHNNTIKSIENKNEMQIESLQDKLNKMISKENELNNKISLLNNEKNKIEKEKNDIEQLIQKIKLNENENIKLKENNKELEEKKEELSQKINEAEELYNKLVNDIEPISLYKSPTLIGLNNIGATCFMNAALQCLSQSKTLSNYFLHNKNKNRIINNNYQLKDPKLLQLSPDYLELIENLWDENRKTPYSPNNFRKTVEQMNPLFKEGQPGDSKDFIIFILEQIHKELKKPINNNTVETPKEELDQYNKKNAFNHFFNDFKNDCSIISDAFFGFNENTNICQNCKNNFNSQGKNNPICYNYQIFNCLIFPLEEVKNMKNNFFGNMNMFFNQNQFQMTNNRVNIYDCFFYNQKDELFTGDNQNFCNICNQLSDSIYSSKIYISPNYLILILNRGKGNIYDVKLDFSETIDITNFVKQKDKPQIIYNLYGVITHLGQSGPNAHFVASCKSPVDNKWYRYNDAFVNPINDVQKDIIDYGTPYILFYHK